VRGPQPARARAAAPARDASGGCGAPRTVPPVSFGGPLSHDVPPGRHGLAGLGPDPPGSRPLVQSNGTSSGRGDGCPKHLRELPGILTNQSAKLDPVTKDRPARQTEFGSGRDCWAWPSPRPPTYPDGSSPEKRTQPADPRGRRGAPWVHPEPPGTRAPAEVPFRRATAVRRDGSRPATVAPPLRTPGGDVPTPGRSSVSAAGQPPLGVWRS
jgi:hypothetical protein